MCFPGRSRTRCRTWLRRAMSTCWTVSVLPVRRTVPMSRLTRRRQLPAARWSRNKDGGTRKIAWSIMPDNGAIHAFVLMSVTDTGTGIAHDILEKALEPYFTTKPEGRGTGLDLSMVMASSSNRVAMWRLTARLVRERRSRSICRSRRWPKTSAWCLTLAPSPAEPGPFWWPRLTRASAKAWSKPRLNWATMCCKCPTRPAPLR